MGVPKLSWFGLPRLWAFITSCLYLRLGWSLKKTCSSPWELFNGVSPSTCTHRSRVDSWLLVVGSQIASLTPDLSFDHNLCCKCPNDLYEAILDIYTSRPFQQYKKHPKKRCFDPCNRVLFGSPEGLSSPIFGSVSGHLTLPSKWGCDNGFYISGYSWLLVDINGYYISGYWWVFYWWQLVVIIGYIMIIGGYCIINNCWLFYGILWLFVIILL